MCHSLFIISLQLQNFPAESRATLFRTLFVTQTAIMLHIYIYFITYLLYLLVYIAHR